MIRHFRGITTRRVASLSLAAALGVWLGASPQRGSIDVLWRQWLSGY
jgi:hypothetical protein